MHNVTLQIGTNEFHISLLHRVELQNILLIKKFFSIRVVLLNLFSIYLFYFHFIRPHPGLSGQSSMCQMLGRFKHMDSEPVPRALDLHQAFYCLGSRRIWGTFSCKCDPTVLYIYIYIYKFENYATIFTETKRVYKNAPNLNK